jgi:hypothetical protein
MKSWIDSAQDKHYRKILVNGTLDFWMYYTMNLSILILHYNMLY